MLVQLDENSSINTTQIVGTYTTESKLVIQVVNEGSFELELDTKDQAQKAQHYLNYASQFAEMATAEAKDMDINDNPVKTLKEYASEGNDERT